MRLMVVRLYGLIIINECSVGKSRRLIADAQSLGLAFNRYSSPYTVQDESYSASRIYDRFYDEATAAVKYVLPRGILYKVVRVKPIGYSNEKTRCRKLTSWHFAATI